MSEIGDDEDDALTLRATAAVLKGKLEGINTKLVGAIAGKRPSAPRLPTIEASEQTHRPKRVLIIEDDTEGRELLSRMLTNIGHTVAVAANGLEGLVRLQDFQPDVAFVDLGLPELDGYAVARRVRVAYGAAGPVLVAYTAYSGAAIRAAALAAGFDHHVTKPLAVDLLIALLKTQRSG